ncbi:MAG: hypothetical protein ACRD27_10115 [Terracidiphilus sp.]
MGTVVFAIVRIAGHSSIAALQRCIHPAPEAMEHAFERLQLSCTKPKTGRNGCARRVIRYTRGKGCRNSLKGL